MNDRHHRDRRVERATPGVGATSHAITKLRQEEHGVVRDHPQQQGDNQRLDLLREMRARAVRNLGESPERDRERDTDG
jgi:hypothetical protein